MLLAVTPVEEDNFYWRDRNIEHARSINDYRSYAQLQVTFDQWICLDELWQRESSWQTKKKPWLATNQSSGAYGIVQALPAEKMNTAGDDWLWNPITQIKWGLKYIKDRYDTPCKALEHHDKKGWY